jgi:hypothetical protein
VSGPSFLQRSDTVANILSATPIQVKYQLLTTVSEQLKNLRSDPRFVNFSNGLAKTRGNELWKTLKPMMHQKTPRDWDDLFELITDAQGLAQVVFNGTDEYGYSFPHLNQPFKIATMQPRDPFQNIHPPEQLEAMGVTVKLGATPLITLRTNAADGKSISETVVKANVLLKTDK